jgi:hypothetical protein
MAVVQASASSGTQRTPEAEPVALEHGMQSWAVGSQLLVGETALAQ